MVKSPNSKQSVKGAKRAARARKTVLLEASKESGKLTVDRSDVYTTPVKGKCCREQQSKTTGL